MVISYKRCRHIQYPITMAASSRASMRSRQWYNVRCPLMKLLPREAEVMNRQVDASEESKRGSTYFRAV